MRKTNVPPVCRACAQLNSAVRSRPTCTVPVGDGQNRVRVAVGAVDGEPVAVAAARRTSPGRAAHLGGVADRVVDSPVPRDLGAARAQALVYAGLGGEEDGP